MNFESEQNPVKKLELKKSCLANQIAQELKNSGSVPNDAVVKLQDEYEKVETQLAAWNRAKREHDAVVVDKDVYSI